MRIGTPLPLALFALSLAGVSLSQAQDPLHISSIRERELIYAFFAFQTDLTDELRRLNTTETDTSKALENAGRALFKVDANEFAIITSISRRTTSTVEDLTQEMSAYLDKQRSTGRQPEDTVVKSFEERRRRALEEGMKHLKAALSSTGWQALTAFIYGDLQSGLTMQRLPSDK